MPMIGVGRLSPCGDKARPDGIRRWPGHRPEREQAGNSRQGAGTTAGFVPEPSRWARRRQRSISRQASNATRQTCPDAGGIFPPKQRRIIQDRSCLIPALFGVIWCCSRRCLFNPQIPQIFTDHFVLNLQKSAESVDKESPVLQITPNHSGLLLTGRLLRSPAEKQNRAERRGFLPHIPVQDS